MSELVTNLVDIPTPAAIIDDKLVHQNIERVQSYFDTHGITLRPHIKTHKLIEYAKAQIDMGAVGISAQKLTEADVMAKGGIDDIFLTYPIIGDEKLARLREHKSKVKRLITVADHEIQIEGLAKIAHKSDPLLVMIECDTGLGRCGVQTPEEALVLAKLISAKPSLKLHGLMTYPAKGGTQAVQDFMQTAKFLLEAEGIEVSVVSSGGTPDWSQAAGAPIVNEYRVGTYIYNDRSLVEWGSASIQECAYVVRATVVSTPNSDRCIIDAGSKTLSSDLLGMEGYGYIKGRDDLKITSLSEEHGTVYGRHGFQIGDQIEILPNHVCVVSNLLDYVWIKREDGYHKTYIDARGTVT